MAIIEYSWKRVSQSQLEECIRWCQNKLNLRDWDITLNTGEEEPKDSPLSLDKEDIGQGCIQDDYLKATIWIPLEKHKKDNYNPYQTCMHEMLHVLTCGVGAIPVEQSEIVSYRLDSLLYRLYCIDHKLKPGKEREDKSD